MAFSFRKLSKRFFVSSNVLAALVFLLACLQPWLNPETFWLISFFSLLLPYLAIVLLLFMVFWLMAKWRYMAISAVALLLGSRQLSTLVALREEKFELRKAAVPGSLRLLTWNVRAMKGLGSQDKASLRKNVDGIYQLIDRFQPDVLCLQEFGQFDKPDEGFDHLARLADLGYRHYVFSKDYSRVAWRYSSGVAIFSRWPLFHKQRVQFTSSPESILLADLQLGADTVRIFTSHLQSFKFSNDEFAGLEAANNSEELAKASSGIFGKMKRAFRNRGAQSNQIAPLLDSCGHPFVIAGDLNDVPGSYAYWKVRGADRQDVFLKTGSGIGRTFMSLAPTLRIDYVFASSQWQVLQSRTISTRLSDHLPVVTDLQLKP
ncbi:MAG: endonuclease/exonuclease/phosphatase family protein [Chitinophagaceae bacterium]|jgi:endonuclease/exonuclease/phosphatase family metal-dependent hydrolase|nr:endonuclease/exonuclease/phosphatase family protein [Chitinophagaceae bacterium]